MFRNVVEDDLKVPDDLRHCSEAKNNGMSCVAHLAKIGNRCLCLER